ncbi:hypothetical protein GCM10023185_38610 [Hymenobacter saemangeumensis]|uniref:Protease n=1 Tax=Hymenobacter saemangeumensis TaxID=1084522 RepID=A0ABP8IRG7_9BACT
MKNVLSAAAICAASVLTLASCQKESEQVVSKNEVTEDVITQVRQMGFSTTGIQAVDGGFLVEGDIVLSKEDLANKNNPQLLRVGDEEQYRTSNLVSVGSGRTISIRVSTSLPSAYITATDEAIRRYNAQGLLIRFTRVTSGGNIVLNPSPSGASYLASAGFPSGGNPYYQVLVNTGAIGTSYASTYIATILAHEFGHCIGFRHTDYMNRQYSCGGSYYNEGASTVGAIHIPGTPTGADPNSWMLACIGYGANRPFNANDVTALRYVY